MKRKNWFVFLLVLGVMALLPAKIAMAGDGIEIDGYYDDWEEIPKTELTYSSINGTEYHEGAILLDGEYLYAYVQMSDTYATQIPLQEYYITINGQTKVFQVWNSNEDGSINWSENTNNLENGSYSDGYGIYYRDGGNQNLGGVAINISEGSGDTLEFAISVKDLEALYGLEEGALSTGVTIEMSNPNIGGETVSMAGSSTGTVIGVVLCLGVAGAGLIFRKKGMQVA